MKIYFIIISSILSSIVFSQEKIYFDADWNKTTADKASFFRISEAVSDSLYSIKDFYIDGKLQMEGFSSTKDTFVYEKTAIWYDEDGIKNLSAEFKNDKTNGKVIHFLKNGEIKYQGIFVNGNATNGYIQDNCKACIASVSEYKNGEVVSSNYFYANSSQIATKKIFRKQEKYSFDDLRLEKVIYFNKKGKQISTLYHNYGDGTYPYPEKGIEILFYNNKDREVTSIESKTTYNNFYKDGLFITYNEDGTIFSEGMYKEGQPYSGSIFQYNKFINYVDGIPSGEYISYDKDGGIYSKAYFKDGDIYEGVERDYMSEKHYKEGELVKIIGFYDYDFKNVKSIIEYLKESKSDRKWFDEKGNIIAECHYKDGSAFDGMDYYSYRKKYTPYKNGEKSGVEKMYTEDNILEKEILYLNDTIVKVSTFLPISNQKITCIYRNERPFNGEEYNHQAIIYKNGEIVKKKSFVRNEKTQKWEYNTIREYNKPYEIKKFTTFKNGNRYELIYKDGGPFEGKEYRNNKLIEYKNGSKNGNYVVYSDFVNDSIIVEKGKYISNKKDGIIQYFPIGEKSFECLYKDGEPYNGTAIEFGDRNTYKNGLKNGICYTDYPYRSSQVYVNGKKEGDFFIVINDFNFGGIYKNDKPYSGSFFDPEATKIKYQIVWYNKGKKDGVFSDYIKLFNILTETEYSNGTLLSKKSIDLDNDSTIAFISFENDKPLSGKMVSLEDEENLIVTVLKKGLKSGVERHYRLSYINKYEDIGFLTFKNGLKNGSYVKKYKDREYNDQVVEGFYKKDKPFKGVFMKRTHDFIFLSNYKNGKKDGLESYINNSKKGKLIYKKGIPYNGEMLEPKDGYYGKFYIHYYKNGKKEKIGIPNYGNETEYFENDNHIIFKNEDLTIKINYSNTEKTDAEIVYFENNNNENENEKEIGRFKITNNKVVSGKLESEAIDKYYTLLQEVEGNNIISKLFSSKHKDVYYNYLTSSVFRIDTLSYKNYNQLKNGLEPQIEEVDFTIYKNGKIISKLEVGEKGIINGVMVTFPDFFDNSYALTLIKDKERIKEVERVNYEDLETEIEKLKHSLVEK